MSQIMRQSTPTDPLVFDDEEAIGALASSVMHAHERLFASGKCYTICMTGDRAALIHGRIESVLSNAFCTIFGQSPIDRFSDIFDQASYIAEHMAKDQIFEDGNKRTSAARGSVKPGSGQQNSVFPALPNFQNGSMWQITEPPTMK